MAEGLFKRFLEVREEAENWRVESAGVWAWDGNPASLGAINALEHRRINISKHRSRSCSSLHMTDYDLSLTMERDHKEALRAEYPALKGRIHLLTEMCGMNYDISDPIGRAPADYEDTAMELERLLVNGFGQIRQMVSGEGTGNNQ